jgi:hypothetical protein
MFRGTFPAAVGPDLALWLLAAAGLVMLWSKRRDRVQAVFMSVFLLFSILAVAPGLYFRSHYFVLVLPAVALLAGATVGSKRGVSWWLFGAALGISILWQRDFLFRLTPIQVSNEMDGSNPFPEAIEIAGYIHAHSAKNTRIAVLGSEPEIYFYSGRRSVSGYIYTYGMMEPHPFALMMQDEMIRDIGKGRPEYVVYVNMQPSWVVRPGSQTKIVKWWNTSGVQDYVPVGMAGSLSLSHTDFHWDDVGSYHGSSLPVITIYRRKSE